MRLDIHSNKLTNSGGDSILKIEISSLSLQFRILQISIEISPFFRRPSFRNQNAESFQAPNQQVQALEKIQPVKSGVKQAFSPDSAATKNKIAKLPARPANQRPIRTFLKNLDQSEKVYDTHQDQH